MKKESVKKETKTKQSSKTVVESPIADDEELDIDANDPQLLIRYYYGFPVLSRSADTIDKLCGRRPCPESSDGFEYALHHKGLSYLHLDWVTKDELDLIDFKSNSISSRFFKKLQTCDQDPNSEILFVNDENFKCDAVLDCIDAVLEINENSFLPGWRMLGRNEPIPKDIKIANLPKTWRERLPEEDKETTKAERSRPSHNDLAGLNPWIDFRKDISSYYATDKNPCRPNHEGSIYAYERLYLVKWMGLSISEATWERECDIDNKKKIQEFEEYNTVPEQIRECYEDYLPENYLSYYSNEKEINLFEAHIQLQQVQPKQEKKKKSRAKPRDSPSMRRNNHLRNCIDPVPPPFDKSSLSFFLSFNR